MSALGAKGSTSWTAALVSVLIGCLVTLTLASPAMAQNPAGVDEYIADGPDFGTEGIASTGGDGGNPAGGDAAGGDGGSNPVVDRAAELPFTGYPLSSAILICLALLLAGLLLRLAIAIRDHSRRTSAETPA